jgi:hypothetical protein
MGKLPRHHEISKTEHVKGNGTSGSHRNSSVRSITLRWKWGSICSETAR